LSSAQGSNYEFAAEKYDNTTAQSPHAGLIVYTDELLPNCWSQTESADEFIRAFRPQFHWKLNDVDRWRLCIWRTNTCFRSSFA